MTPLWAALIPSEASGSHRLTDFRSYSGILSPLTGLGMRKGAPKQVTHTVPAGHTDTIKKGVLGKTPKNTKI